MRADACLLCIHLRDWPRDLIILSKILATANGSKNESNLWCIMIKFHSVTARTSVPRILRTFYNPCSRFTGKGKDHEGFASDRCGCEAVRSLTSAGSWTEGRALSLTPTLLASSCRFVVRATTVRERSCCNGRNVRKFRGFGWASNPKMDMIDHKIVLYRLFRCYYLLHVS